MPHNVDEQPDMTSAMRNAASTAASAVAQGHRRLVLCFDGTANKFQANRSDTNIVKIYQMLERNTMDQFHYYQRMLISTCLKLK